MQLILYRYECRACGNIYKSPQLCDNPYGRFLLKNRDGKMAYLNAFDKEVFEEVSKIFDANTNIIELKNYDGVTIFQSIFGIACDNESDVSPYSIMQKPICP